MSTQVTADVALPRDEANSASHRNVGLDLLRALAIVLVLFNHALVPERDLPGGTVRIFTALRDGGWVGVDLFFVLSGFLVSGLLFADHDRNGRASVGRFLIRRGFKIYPAFWILVAYAIVRGIRHATPMPVHDVVGELCFLQNYLGRLWSHTWSLAVEEHFYLALAALVWLLQRRRRDPFAPISAICLAVAVACLALRILTAMIHPDYDTTRDLEPTHLRIDALFFGVWLSWAVRYGGLRRRLRWFAPWMRCATGLVFLLPAFLFPRDEHRWISVIGFTLFYFGSGLLLLGAFEVQATRNRVVRFAARIGSASYSIYLWHLVANAWSGRFLAGHHELLYLVSYFGGALLLGWLAMLVIERPVLAFRDRHFRSHGAVVELPKRG